MNTINNKFYLKNDFKAYLDKAGIEGSILTSELGARNTPGNQPGLYYLHGDHLGTATFVTDYSGSTTQFFLNLPFGERTGAFDNWYRFNAKELDKETNFYYYGAKYYNPSLSIRGVGYGLGINVDTAWTRTHT